MEKKMLFIVTETFMDLKKNSVNTFVTGASEELEGAEIILRYTYECKLKIGYQESNFKMDNWSWTYIHDYGLIRADINITYF